MIKKINDYLKEANSKKFIIVMVLLDIVLAMITFMMISLIFPEYVKNAVNNMGGINYEDSTLIEKGFFTIILASLIETFIFQHTLILCLKKIPKIKNITIIILSSLIFGISHNYSVLYMIRGFTSGIILAYSYITYLDKNESPFLIVFYIHSILNLIAILA